MHTTIRACDEGLEYREVAKLMSKSGVKMSHSSAQNYLFRAMKAIASAVAVGEVDFSDAELDLLVRKPHFQRAVVEVLQSTGYAISTTCEEATHPAAQEHPAEKTAELARVCRAENLRTSSV